MFTLKKILAPFLLPPGIFIVLLVFAGIYFLFKNQWKAGFFNFFIGISMWLLSITPVSDTMLRGLESDFKIPKNLQGDVIILLGGGIYDEAPDLTGMGIPSDEMCSRLITAVRLQKNLDIPIIISGGSVFSHKKTEAVILKRFLIDLGVPSDKIIVEDKSRDTIENARYTKEICKKFDYKNPILVTSALHMKRAVLSFEKVDMDVIPFPANYKTWNNKRYGWKEYLPDTFEDINLATYEYLGLLFYKFAY